MYDHYFQTSSLKLPGQSKPIFVWSDLGKGGKKVYIKDPGNMTKMAAMSIYGKNHQKSSPTELGMEHHVLKLYKVYINDDPELTF